MLRLRRPATWVTAVVLGFAPAPALAQIPLAISAPGAGAQLLEPSRPAPITLTPTIAVFEEYNDRAVCSPRTPTRTVCPSACRSGTR